MSKGNFSCHSFTAQGRDNYEEIFRKRKRHQKICQEVEAMQLPTAHESATVKDYYKDMSEKLKGHEKPHMNGVDPACDRELTAYEMMMQEGLERN
jgi:hypothetical protein